MQVGRLKPLLDKERGIWRSPADKSEGQSHHTERKKTLHVQRRDPRQSPRWASWTYIAGDVKKTQTEKGSPRE